MTFSFTSFSSSSHSYQYQQLSNYNYSHLIHFPNCILQPCCSITFDFPHNHSSSSFMAIPHHARLLLSKMSGFSSPNHTFLALWILFFSLLPTPVPSKTASNDVSALNVMFTSLNSPSKLTNWKASGGDPCGESWEGIECSGSSVTKIALSGLGLSGQLGYKLSSLKSVTEFDLSNNNLKDDIPYQLPPNLVSIDFSENSFTGNVPFSLSEMRTLKKINLAHNKLNGQLSDMFGKLTKLTELDLSFNKLTGNLPRSFANLTSLDTLYLQENKFTGSINALAYLPLKDLNVGNNKFTGWIPNELKDIDSLETGGNSWSSGRAPPPPPGFRPPRRPNSDEGGGEGGGGLQKSVVKGLVIAGIVIAVIVVIIIIIALCTRRRSAPSSHFLDEEMNNPHKSFTPLTSKELSHDMGGNTGKDTKDQKLTDSSTTIDIKALQKSSSIGSKPFLSGRIQAITNNDATNPMGAKRSISFRAIYYSLADLLSATDNFAKSCLLGEGSIGRVYRAKYSDEKVLAVKKIDPSFFQHEDPEKFPEIVTSISKLHHPNIAELIGYCSEEQHKLLVYEYYANGSLHEFLHMSDDFSKPLTWNTRVRIALGTARAVEYLHEVCSPSVIHKNIKSPNILLDIDLNPHLSDCGLATCHQGTSQNLGVGYNAPECTEPSAYTSKSDVYSFGVVMLELLTGRKPFDSSKPTSEQFLVGWATPQLHDVDALERMADPALRGLYDPNSLSQFADVIALCVKRESGYRPPMSEVVQALVRLVQR